MKRLLWLVTVPFVLVACAAPTPVVQPTPSVSVEPTPEQTPTPKRPRVPSARQVLFVAEGAIWIYDVRSDAVSQLARGEGIRQARWVGPKRVSYVAGPRGRRNSLNLIDIESRSVEALFVDDNGIDRYAWSPDFQTVAYISRNAYGYPRLIYRSMSGDGAVQTVATLARVYGREYQPDDQEHLEFSPNGQYLLVVYTPADGEDPRDVPEEQSQLQVRHLNGALMYAVDHYRNPTMGVWARDGSHIAFVSDDSLRGWRPGQSASGMMRGGEVWFNPWSSPNGAFYAYDTGGRSPRVRTLDARTGRRTDVGGTGFFRPVVPNQRTVWAERTSTSEVMAFDLRNGNSKKIALPTLHDVDVLYR